MRPKIGLVCAAVILAGAVLMGATCSGPGQGNGALRLVITDKPFPFEFIESAVVTLTRVSVHKAGPTEPADTEESVNADEQASGQAVEEDDGQDGEWITIFEDSAGKDFDLVELRNGRTNLLANTELPAGTYNQVRLVVSGGEVTLTDGRTFPLKVPSGDTSGIKLHFTFEVVEGETTDLLLDVDLSRTFKPIPGGKIDTPDQIKQFHFHPSIAMRLINLVEAGSISGTVTDSAGAGLGGVAVTAYKDDVEVTSTQTEDDGTYQLLGLTTGTYRVEFTATGFVDAEVADVSVTAGQDTAGVNATLTASQ